MKITVMAKTKKKIELVQQVSEKIYTVSVKEPAIEGRANSAIINALAKYFKISPSLIVLIKGETSKTKIFEISSQISQNQIKTN